MTGRRIVVTAVLGLLVMGCSTVSVPEPRFQRVVADGPFELRDYPSLLVAEVTVEGGQWGAANRGFRLLARYIFGGNAPGQSIAMTAPVTQAPATEESWVVRFVMPEGFRLDTLPPPLDPAVRLAERHAARVAVRRFSGWAVPGDFETQGGALLRWMSARGLEPDGPLTLAQYDPPWTIWFLRRNEMMVAVRR